MMLVSVSVKQPIYMMVDDEDYDRVTNHCWNIKRSTKSSIQVRSDVVGYVERFIMGVTESDKVVIHKNFNSLDCRKENLIVISESDIDETNTHENGSLIRVGKRPKESVFDWLIKK